VGEHRPGRRREVGARSLERQPLTELVVRVQPDQTGLAKTFDYAVPPEWAERVAPGTMVRIALGPRRVAAWVREVGVEPEAGVEPKPLAKISGIGPSREVIELADWARWRWAARTPVPFLRTASPPRMVTSLPTHGVRRHPVPPVDDDVVQGAFDGGATVLRLPPNADDIPVVQAATSLGDSLIVCASRSQAVRVAGRLRRAGVPTALHPDGWAQAAAGGVTVVGTRAAIWASLPELASIVVFDEHDEVHQEERTPTWHVREVAVERARRLGIPCVLTSPMPSLEALGTARLVTVDRAIEREGWPKVVVADRRDEDAARNALFSPAFVAVARSAARVVCILNQKGRAVLLACGSCHDLARCDRCDAAVQRPGDDELVCRRCGATRPVVCASCGSTRLKTVRMGVSRVRDDLEALAGEPVVAVTADDEAPDDASEDAPRLFVGTEAALHRIDHADVVAFLDLDQELLASRHRAAEQALALLVRAARLVGPRHGTGRLLLQTRSPDHEVVRAALHGDPTLVSDAERARRRDFRFPPEVAMAEVSGESAPAFVDALAASPVLGVDVAGPMDGTWRITAPDHRVLCDALDGVERPSGRLRLAVDPTRS
jgi:primosomal protein N' (replication factor Y) (superfamily II helicase)